MDGEEITIKKFEDLIDHLMDIKHGRSDTFNVLESIFILVKEIQALKDENRKVTNKYISCNVKK